ncbi:hypothetical protein ACFL10_01555 [Patescibacteria group bacterium]
MEDTMTISTHRTTTLTFCLVTALAITGTGCNNRSVGANNNLNNNTNTNDNSNVNENTNENQNTNTGPTMLTRRIMYVDVVDEVMGFDLAQGPGCPAHYPDVASDGNDEKLCWAINVAVELGMEPGFPNGQFEPEQLVLQAEMWRTVRELVGFLPFSAQCALIVGEDEWYTPELGSLCEKGLIPIVPEPAENLTLSEWSDHMFNLRAYMAQPAIRLFVGELLLGQMDPSMVDLDVQNCVSVWEDVASYSFECLVVENLTELAIFDPIEELFRGADPMTWGEIIKLVAVQYELEGPVDCTPICDMQEGHWACGYAQALCSFGLLPEGLEDLTDVPTVGEAAHLFYSASIELN